MSLDSMRRAEDQRHAHLPVYTVQWWHGKTLIGELCGKTYADAIAFATRAQPDFTSRVLCCRCPWTEVWTPDGAHRSGHFAETTRVHVPAGDQP